MAARCMILTMATRLHKMSLSRSMGLARCCSHHSWVYDDMGHLKPGRCTYSAQTAQSLLEAAALCRLDALQCAACPQRQQHLPTCSCLYQGQVPSQTLQPLQLWLIVSGQPARRLCGVWLRAHCVQPHITLSATLTCTRLSRSQAGSNCTHSVFQLILLC